jgi:microcin C transport system permease protein
MGKSYVFAEPVLDVIVSRFPVSIYFGLIGFTLTYLICVPLGVAKAVKNGSKFDFVSSVIVFMGYSTPGWAFGVIMLVLFGGGSFWNVFPLGGFRSEDFDTLSTFGQIWDQIQHTILPVISYMVGSFATLTILTKNSVIENLSQDYIRTAFAKGISEKKVIFKHALRNSLIPIATGLGHFFSLVLAGSFLIEKVFNIQGMGLLGFNSIIQRDYPVTMGILVLSSILLLIGNIISDILYATIDPRIRFK